MPSKRAYRGPAASSTAAAAAAAAAVGGSTAGAKKRRGPKAIIDLPRGNRANGARTAPAADGSDMDEDEDEEIRAALEAQDMAGAGESSEEEDSEEEVAEQRQAKRRREVKGKGKDAEEVAFLLNLDSQAIGRSRAEIARIAKAERAAERSERNHAARQRAERSQVADESDASTDMEGLSIASGSNAGGDSDLSSLDFDSDEELDSDSDDGMAPRAPAEERDVEEEHAERLRVQQKRKAASDAALSAERAKRRLPVRAAEGWQSASDVSGDEDESTISGDDADAIAKSRVVHAPIEDDEESASSEDEEARRKAAQPASTITTGARFGMLAPYAILGLPKRSQRVAAAREQIARLSTDIVGDPEVSLGMLRRLAVFAGRTISAPEDQRPAGDGKMPKRPVDDAIRAAAIMSLCAVFVDILPGYRIRALTDAEQKEKTNQETARRREWEQGLVDTYRGFLEICDKILRVKIPLSAVALRSMCLLLTRATHFNYRTNLIRALVSQLSRRGWSEDSAACASALTEVLRADLRGDVSLEVVRLLNRMIKERGYRVNARVLDLLLHLRLRDELGGRRGDMRFVDRKDPRDVANEDARTPKRAKIGKGKATPKEVRKGLGKHLSKKEVKSMRERKEIEAELREADAEVDVEERTRNQTETLKLLFVLYFSILKATSVPGPLLASALEGLARFAHRINVDFFRDLLAVLRTHVAEALAVAETQSRASHGGAELASDNEGEADDDGETGTAAWGADAVKTRSQRRNGMREALLCLVTAFELLSGQGEALNIDLADMAAHLYGIMIPLSLSPTIEDAPELLSGGPNTEAGGKDKGMHLLRTDADLLLRALELILLRPRAATLSSERTAAFAKRALTCALQLPPATAIRLLGIVRACVARDARLEAFLDTQDRAKDGRYDATSDDVDAARPLGAGEAAWELHLLMRSANADVAAEAKRVASWQR